MTKFKVEIRKSINDYWDGDCIDGGVMAENALEAYSEAHGYISDYDDADDYMYRVVNPETGEETIYWRNKEDTELWKHLESHS